MNYGLECEFEFKIMGAEMEKCLGEVEKLEANTIEIRHNNI